MNTLQVSALRDAADQLSVLAGVFEIPAAQLKANSIRRADKSLVTLEALFTQNLATSGLQWIRAQDALLVLQRKLKNVELKDRAIEEVVEKTEKLKQRLEVWTQLDPTEKNRILQHARTATHFFEHRLYNAESYVIHRYQRYEALRTLSPYADNADYLCEAIYHFENRHKYEENLSRLETKRAEAHIRLKTVKRGFYLSLIFALFLVTIPLCLPFAFSLWSRRRDIETQLANIEETLRREERRLTAADEGVIASQEIREVLGDVSLEQVRSTLGELRELRAEFQGPHNSPTVTSTLLTFLDLYRPLLTKMFGEIPAEPVSSFKWLEREVSEILEIESRVAVLEKDELQLRDEKKSITRGYSAHVLRDSIENLRKVKESAIDLPLSDEIKAEFASVCRDMPELLGRVKNTLRHFCNGYSLTEEQWKSLQVALKSAANIFNASVLSLEIDILYPASHVEGQEEHLEELVAATP